MDKDTVIKQLKKSKKKLADFKVKSLALFGSVVRGEARPDSDIDLLVEFEGPTTFDRFMKLRFFLEDLLGSHVDLITRKGIRPEILPYVEKEALYVP